MPVSDYVSGKPYDAKKAAKFYADEAVRAAGRGDMAEANEMRRRQRNAEKFDEDVKRKAKMKPAHAMTVRG